MFVSLQLPPTTKSLPISRSLPGIIILEIFSHELNRSLQLWYVSAFVSTSYSIKFDIKILASRQNWSHFYESWAGATMHLCTSEQELQKLITPNTLWRNPSLPQQQQNRNPPIPKYFFLYKDCGSLTGDKNQKNCSSMFQANKLGYNSWQS